MSNNKDCAAKVIAMYFPQLHAIPENDDWWGAGFTDWVNVKKAEPQYDGHRQPRIPAQNRYYDQSQVETLRWQVDLAREHGIYGFCQYHYWFDGKQLLETPTRLLLDNKDIDIPFCLSWANETWSKRWDGRDHDILIKQEHPPSKERWKLHFDYLVRVWDDDRSIKVNDKPVFAIYRPQMIHEIDNMIDYWRELAVQYGLNGLYMLFQKQYELPDKACLKSFDAAFQFQPFEAIYSPGYGGGAVNVSKLVQIARKLPLPIRNILHKFKDTVSGLTFHDYEAIWEEIVKIHPNRVPMEYPGAFVDWDNTARYKERATIINGSDPERFRYWFNRLVATMRDRDMPENFIFINAWNEWAESAYLEPDVEHGLTYLEIIRDALKVTDAENHRSEVNLVS